MAKKITRTVYKMHCAGRCGKELAEDQFYLNKRGSRCELCKKCLTDDIKNTEPDTYLPVLKRLDFPYVEQIWRKILYSVRKKYPTNPKKWIGGKDVLGRYISRMRTNQWDDFYYEDSLNATKYYENITTDNYKYDKDGKIYATADGETVNYTALNKFFSEGELIGQAAKDVLAQTVNITESSGESVVEKIDAKEELTKDDLVYLSLKWGNAYTIEDCLELEVYYNDMSNSFPIENASRENNLKWLAKINLKMNKAFDSGSIEDFIKLQKTYDSFMKSGKFTEAQNKDGNQQGVNAACELVKICEQDGFIPRFCTDTPQDKVDETINDMQKYVRNLVLNDMGFGKQFEAMLGKYGADEEEERKDKSEADSETQNVEDEDDFFNNLEYPEDLEEEYKELTDENMPDASDCDFMRRLE